MSFTIRLNNANRTHHPVNRFRRFATQSGLGSTVIRTVPQGVVDHWEVVNVNAFFQRLLDELNLGTVRER
ncbi:hypothetical protein D3C78_1578490 [compost metagenome]